jgi:hypothetical protein
MFAEKVSPKEAFFNILLVSGLTKKTLNSSGFFHIHPFNSQTCVYSIRSPSPSLLKFFSIDLVASSPPGGIPGGLGVIGGGARGLGIPVSNFTVSKLSRSRIPAGGAVGFIDVGMTFGAPGIGGRGIPGAGGTPGVGAPGGLGMPNEVPKFWGGGGGAVPSGEIGLGALSDTGGTIPNGGVAGRGAAGGGDPGPLIGDATFFFSKSASKNPGLFGIPGAAGDGGLTPKPGGERGGTPGTPGLGIPTEGEITGPDPAGGTPKGGLACGAPAGG